MCDINCPNENILGECTLEPFRPSRCLLPYLDPIDNYGGQDEVDRQIERLARKKGRRLRNECYNSAHVS